MLASKDARNPTIGDPAVKASVLNEANALGLSEVIGATINPATNILIEGGGTSVPSTAQASRLREVAYYRETFGLEKTFLNGDASIGFRLPLIQIIGDNAFSDIGDLSIVLKYAFFNDLCTGNLISGGLVVTAPTGGSFGGPGEELDTTLLQPYMGFIYNSGNFYLQGFSGVVIPTNSNDVLFLGNDLGLGYRMYENPGATLSAVTPVVEVHVTTPLNNRDGLDGASIPDIVSFTGGLNFQFGERSIFTMGVNSPVTGPRPDDYEVFAQFNYAFGPNPTTFTRNPPVR